jgi:hypothetical protein
MTHAPSPARRLARTSAALLLALPVLSGLVATSAPAGADEPSPAVLTTVPLETVAGPQDEVEGAARQASRVGVRGRTKAEPLLVGSTATGYTPAQVRAHLGLTGTGAGQTIAIVTAYDAPNVVADLAVFNRTFSLPAPPSFRKVNQSGGSKLPSANGTWALETALDVQWAHAVAPDAHLLLVEASSSAMGNLLAAVTWAASQPGVTVISGSWGTPEFSGQGGQDYRCRLVTAVCVFASGDNGGRATYPATMPNALAVGGTNLSLAADGSVLSETAWSGSGGGISLYSPKPAFQAAVNTGTRRAAPDVSYAAGEPAGFPVYSTTPVNRQTGWFQMSGTSAGAPQWAGILAASNELRKAAGKGPLTAVNAAGGTPLHSALYTAPSGLRDVVVGTNGTCGQVCSALPGYDTVTGLGSPAPGLDLVLRSAP